LAIAQDIGDRFAEAASLRSLGSSWAKLGKPRKSVECYGASLVIAQEVGDRSGEGNALVNLAIAYAALGQQDQAILHAERALSIFQVTQSPRADTVRRLLDEWAGGPDTNTTMNTGR